MWTQALMSTCYVAKEQHIKLKSGFRPKSVYLLFYYSVDPFTKKDWYDVKAPSMFTIRQIGKTMVTRTAGTSKFFH